MLASSLQELGNTQEIRGVTRAKAASLSPNMREIKNLYYIDNNLTIYGY
jgi:hypothetical protein